MSALDDHLGYWLRAVSNHVSHAFKTRVEQHGVTVAEWVVLRALFDRPHAQPSELAATLGLTRGAVSKLVDRLAKKRLVSVRSAPHDGRAQRIALTPSARRLVPRLASLADENDAAAFRSLTPTQRAALRTTLRDLATHLGLHAPPLD